MFSSTIELKGTKEDLSAYFAALEPEESESGGRASYKLKLGKTLVIEIKAEDATAFRAVTNTIVGLISVVEKSINSAKA